MGAPTVGVLRPELHRVLAGAVEDADIRLGTTCTGFSQDGEGVSVRFEPGGEQSADMLIGADGLRSAVRRGLRGDEPLRFAKYASWQAVVDYADEATPIGLFSVFWGPEARFLFYRVSDRQLYWEGIFATEAGGRDPDGGRKDAVLERFGDWVRPVGALVSATDEAAISRADVYDRPPIKRWSQGRVTLLGDAAHPMTNAVGQGANQAIEDAVVLAKCLRAVSDPPAALAQYERERVGRTARTARLAWNLTTLSRWRRPASLALRERVIKVAFALVGKRIQRKDMAYEL